MGRLGGDADLFLTQAGLEGVNIDDEKLIPTHCLCNALEIASEQLGAADFGLQLSLHQDLDILGPIALLIQNANTLNDVLDIVTRHMHTIHNQSEQILVSVEKNQVYLQHVKMIPNVTSDVQITLLGFGFAARMAQQRLEPGVIADAIYFTHPEPEDSRLYREIFNTNIYFNQTFSGSAIDLSAFQKGHTIKQVNVENVESFLLKNNNQAATLSQQLRILLSQTLSSSEQGLPYYANQLQMSERTLQRRLSLEGQSFTRLVDQLRKDTAKRYVDDQFYNMAQISDMLGFSDPAVFTRAFTRWYGISPKRYAKSL